MKDNLINYISQHFWQYVPKEQIFTNLHPAQGFFLCIRSLTRDDLHSKMYHWFFVPKDDGRAIAIAPNNKPINSQETWFSNHEGCCEAAMYMENRLDLLIFSRVPSRLFQEQYPTFDESDEFFIYRFNEEDDFEKGELPEGITKEQLHETFEGKSKLSLAKINSEIQTWVIDIPERNHIRYNVKGLGEGFNRRQLVYAIVKNWAENNSVNFKQLRKAFPKNLQGELGVVERPNNCDLFKFEQEYLDLEGDGSAVICHEWDAEHIDAFVRRATELGYEIVREQGEEEDLQEYILDNCWQFPIGGFAHLQPPQGFLLCLGYRSKDEVNPFSVWINVPKNGEFSSVIAPKNKRKGLKQTWLSVNLDKGWPPFSQEDWELPRNEDHSPRVSGLDIKIFRQVPTRLHAEEFPTFDENDDYFMYQFNEEKNIEKGTLPIGISREDLLGDPDRTKDAIRRLHYHIIAGFIR